MKLNNVSSAPLMAEQSSAPLFSIMAKDLLEKGFSIKPFSLPYELSSSLSAYAQSLGLHRFKRAGTGRDSEYQVNRFVRSDSIYWLTGRNIIEQTWLNWCGELQTYLNRQLFLGLRSFESHLACYQRGQFYKRHYDAFRGQSNRILSLAAYFNPEWLPGDAGELVLYTSDDDHNGIKVRPDFGTILVFLSEEFPHEVLPANKTRLSVAGWFSQEQQTVPL